MLFLFFTQLRLHAKYYAIVDGGSTGSTIYLMNIFEVDGKIAYKVFPIKNHRQVPGLAHVLPKDVTNYISPLITNLKKSIPQGVKESDIDFYYMATGDMRAVSPEVQTQVYSAMRDYFSKNTEMNIIYTGTMPEKMEGVYDWLCINIVEDKIGTDSTYGVIDIGGSSIQVAYAVTKDMNYTQEVKIAESSYFVYSRSYLGIGNDQARLQFLDDPSTIPKDLALVTTTGDGDYLECLKDVKTLLVDVHHVQPVPQEILTKTKFIGFSYFYYLAASKEFDLGNEVSINDIKTKAMEFSKLNWAEMKTKWPNDKYLHAYYLGSALVIDLLEVLGFKPDTKIHAQELYGGAGDSWAVGAAAYFYYGNHMQ